MSRPSKPPSDAEVDELREVFACFDRDSSGAVTTAELAHMLKSINKNYTEEQLKNIIRKFDVNGDGQIDFDEFLTIMKRHEVKDGDELKQAFDVFDKDGDGSISANELEMVMRALGEPIDRQTLDLMIESVDSDRNGSIDIQEFKRMMNERPAELEQ